MKKFRKIVRYPYYKIRASAFVSHILNLFDRPVLHALESCSSEVDDLMEKLRKDGFSVTSLEKIAPEVNLQDLVESSHTFRENYEQNQETQNAISKRRVVAPKGANKDFLIPLYGGAWETPVLHATFPFVPLMFSVQVLAIAGFYLNSYPHLNSFNLSMTRVLSYNSKPRLSQRWHRDPEDRRVLKVFLYLSDVTKEEDGPFMYVRGSQRGGCYERVFPQRPPAGMYPPDGSVEKLISASDIMKLYGEAGTVIFADTVGLHKGGYSTESERMMFTSSYVTRAAWHPRKYKVDQSILSLSKLARRSICE